MASRGDTKKSFVSLYKMYVRPHLEFAVPIWNPWLRKDVEVLERVQKKFVKNINGLTSTTYEDRLKEIGMLDLSTRRLYLDLVEAYKLIHNITRVNRAEIFELVMDNQRRTTRNTECPVNIISKRCNLEIRRHFFSLRIIESWNNLPVDIKMCNSLSMFKANLNSHLFENYSDMRRQEDTVEN